MERTSQPPSSATIGAIHDHGIIGDCRSAALINRWGTLDWLCWPRFDSPAIFAAILDAERGGCWRICPSDPLASSREYVQDTNVLKTTIRGFSGIVVLTDLMPVASENFKKRVPLPDHEIVRQVECTGGEVEVELDFHPRANFGERAIAIHDRGTQGLQMHVGRGVYSLHSSISLSAQGTRVRSHVRMREGQRIQFSLTYSEESPAVLPIFGEAIEEAIARSIAWWQDWAARARYNGPYREAVVRSALVLKLLTYSPSGAVIAAPSTSLPEHIGGSWNWDYRYCWLRDASLTIRALLELGYTEEAGSFMDWMLHATRLTRPELRILYNVYGGRAQRESCLEFLCGYMDSKPVRVGNAAREQLQLDVYGEVIDGAAQYAFHGGEFDLDMRKALSGFGNYVVNHWQEPDEGIWEPRTGRELHTHSKLLCWTALDRLIKLSAQGHLEDKALESFKTAREEIRRQIRKRAWNKKLQSYVSVLDGDAFDASLLLLSWYGFEKADSQRMQCTYRALRKYLGAGDSLLYRYRTDPPEGAFAICCFWGAEFLALGGGSLEDAHEHFQSLLEFQNDLGLYAEEIDPASGAALGNFPQAFTHVGLIGAALSIEEREKGGRQLPHRPHRPAVHAEEVPA
jgi:GH15 family glucan-1,4-alpha-glucosidase